MDSFLLLKAVKLVSRMTAHLTVSLPLLLAFSLSLLGSALERLARERERERKEKVI